MTAIRLRLLRDLLKFLEVCCQERPFMYKPTAERLLRDLQKAKAPKRSAAPARARRTAKAKTRREEWADVREQVLKRADGVCENPECEGVASEVDHFFGGSGRRQAMQSVETCWALCRDCHLLKTRNQPGADFWLERFAEFAAMWTLAASVEGLEEEEVRWAKARAKAEARLESLQLQGRAPNAP